jgi:hypothetical protein
MDRYAILKNRAASVPKQHSQEWYYARFMRANSSQYGAMCNVRGRREEALMEAAKMEKSESNFLMDIGTKLEDTSGLVFTATTGMKYDVTGSLGHPDYPKEIGGSVDGFGLDHEGKIFVLETKTPSKRVPGPRLGEILYMYQVLQNIEIVNGDYGLFNDVRLLACTTGDLLDPTAAHDMLTHQLVDCTFKRYQLAMDPSRLNPKAPPSLDPINLIAVGIMKGEDVGEDDGEKQWMGNIFDSFVGSVLPEDTFEKLITGPAYDFVPIACTREVGESAREWTETVLDQIRESEKYVGLCYFKLDVHLIQRIERDTKFWETYQKPVALKWYADLEAARRGKIAMTEEKDEHDLPKPSQYLI